MTFEDAPTEIEFSDFDGVVFAPELIQGSLKSGANTGVPGKSGFTVYPNPNSGKFQLHLNSYSDLVHVKVMNATGNTVFEEKEYRVSDTRTLNMDLGNLPEGVYMITIDDDHLTNSEKIVIRK